MKLPFLQSIRDLRVAAGMSQRELGHLAGIDQSLVSKIEGGGKNAEAATLQSIAAALDAEFVLVPRRVLAHVRQLIEEHVESADRAAAPAYHGSDMADDLFIPDDVDDDDEVPAPRSGGFRP
jgi:transcriptional regulator with XRE-family HTH domain